MADDESSSTSDETLDARSDKFDPLKALYASKIRFSSSAAPVFDNVSKFESVLKGLHARAKKDEGVTTSEETGECSTSRFQPHQEPVPGRSRGGARGGLEGKNLFLKMQKTHGPLGMLQGCMNSRIRVKVYTRNERGIRGHVEAYVAAFDKHWNLALEDCFEVWTRRVKRKAPALGAPQVNDDTTRAKGEAPRTVTRSIDGKTETLERHVPQMLLRGEQVALIVKIN